MKASRVGLLLATWAILLLPTAAQQRDVHPITPQEIAALKTAILDEIYDYDFEGAYTDISRMGPHGYELPLYIRPDIIANAGEVIYKLPIGEVARIFQFNDSLVVLIREPRDKFPPTSSSTLTLYLDDEEICAAKKNSIHEVLSIDPNPSKQDVRAAIGRERQRKGTSQHDEIAKSRRRRHV